MRPVSANMLLAGLIAALSCGDDPTAPDDRDIAITRFTVLLGDAARLTAEITDADGDPAAGTAVCWGWGAAGQLGHEPDETCGPDLCSTSPRIVATDIPLPRMRGVR